MIFGIIYLIYFAWIFLSTRNKVTGIQLTIGMIFTLVPFIFGYLSGAGI